MENIAEYYSEGQMFWVKEMAGLPEGIVNTDQVSLEVGVQIPVSAAGTAAGNLDTNAGTRKPETAP